MVGFATRPMLALALAAGLAGCVDNIPDVAVSRGDVRRAIAQGSLKSPRPASLAFASLDGAPSGQDVRFKALFDKEAADREIAMVEPKTARYLVRGYLNAAPGERGVEVAYVYDVFDAEHRRVERVADTMVIPPAANQDAWSAVDDRVMASLAARSADDLAVALSGTPEAQSGPAAGQVAQATAHAPN